MIYLNHFGLREAPFGITPDTSFFFSCESMQQALNTLVVAVGNGEGFIKVTGEVGTGKSLLCRKLLTTLGEGWVSAYLPNPDLDSRGLLLALRNDLGVVITAPAPEPEPDPSLELPPVTDGDVDAAVKAALAARRKRARSRKAKAVPDAEIDRHQLIDGLQRRLMEIASQGKRALVCLDEVQAMPVETLETLRLLTNLETEKQKLLQVVLFGQPELDEKLAHQSIRQLRQRITFQHRLAALSQRETGLYLEHRMTVAGYMGDRVFSPLAVRAIHGASGGIPRLVNILANKALLAAYGRGRRRIGWREASIAVNDTPAADRRRRAWHLAAVAGTAAAVGLAIGWLLLGRG